MAKDGADVGQGASEDLSTLNSAASKGSEIARAANNIKNGIGPKKDSEPPQSSKNEAGSQNEKSTPTADDAGTGERNNGTRPKEGSESPQSSENAAGSQYDKNTPTADNAVTRERNQSKSNPYQPNNQSDDRNLETSKNRTTPNRNDANSNSYNRGNSSNNSGNRSEPHDGSHKNNRKAENKGRGQKESKEKKSIAENHSKGKKKKPSKFSLLLFKIKLILFVILLIVFIIGMVSLGMSSAIINENIHVNQSETMASTIGADGQLGSNENGYDILFSATTSKEDIELAQKTYQDGKARLDKVINNAVEEANSEMNSIVSQTAIVWKLAHPLEPLYYDYKPEVHNENRPCADEDALFCTSAYSASMQNLLSKEADTHYTENQISQLQDMENKLQELVSQAPDSEIAHESGARICGNYIISSDLFLTFEVREVGEEETATFLVVEKTFYPANYDRVCQKAFDYTPDSPFDAEQPDITMSDYIYEISAATAEMLGIETAYGYDNGLHMYDAMFVGQANGDVLRFARNYIGYDTGVTYAQWYGFNSRVAWCACFVSWVTYQLGYIDSGVCPKASSCSVMMSWYQNHNQYQSAKNYVPKAGDIVFFDWDRDHRPDHVGFVKYAVSGKVYTIEGNTTKDGNGATGVFERERNPQKILGYGIPRYDKLEG